MESEEAVKYPSQHDFLLGRGGETNNHSGNILFRQLIREFKEAYQNAPKTQKPLISQKLVAKWRGMSPPGRFLERNEQDKVWRDVGDVVACRKTSKALGERGKRNKLGNLEDDEEIAAPNKEASSAAAGNKRKMEDLNAGESPASSRVKAAPPTPAPTTSMSLPAGSVLVMPTAPASAGAPAAASGLSSFLQNLGTNNQALTSRTAAALSASGNGLTALIERHQKQQQQSSVAALLELQTRQQQQLLQPNVDLAALLGQASAPAATSTATDLTAWLSEQQAKQDLASLLGHTTAARPTAASNSADLASLLIGQQQRQQQQQQKKKSQVDISTFLQQNANTPLGVNDLAALLAQQKQKNDLVALLEQQQKKQQAQSSLAALLDQQQQQQQQLPQNSELAALLEQQSRSQKAQSTLAALLDQQQQNSSLAVLLEQQKKQQLEKSLAALLDQKKKKQQQQQQQLEIAVWFGKQPTQPNVTPEQLQSTIAAVLEQQQKTQQLQASLAAVLGHQPTQQHIQLATFLQQESKPTAALTLGTDIDEERLNSILSDTSVPPATSQAKSESMLAASSASQVLDSKPPAMVPNNVLSDFLANLGGGHQGTSAPAAASLHMSSANSSARLQSQLEGSQDTLAAHMSASTTGNAFPHVAKSEQEPPIVQRLPKEPGTKTTGLTAVVANSAQRHQYLQQQADVWQMLAAAKDKTRQHPPAAAPADNEDGNVRVTATLAAALRQME